MIKPETPKTDRRVFRSLLRYGMITLVALISLVIVLDYFASSSGQLGGSDNAIDFKNKIITLHLSTEPPQLNSSLTTDMLSGMILGHVMEGLLRYDERNKLVPGVAKDWVITEDSATFWLRSDAKWSNGKPVTAHDFVFSWKLALDPKNASEYAFILHPIANAEAITQNKLPITELGVTAIDDYTLKVELERPIAYFDKLVAFPTYYPINEDFYKKQAARYGAEANTLIYNGPFALTDWIHGARLRMKKNDWYWNKSEINLNGIDFAYITSDPNAALNLFKDDKIAHTGLSSENLKEAMEERWDIRRFMDGSVFFIEYNFRKNRITSNYHLRKAIQLAINPSELVYKVTKLPGYLPGESIFPRWLKGNSDYFRLEYPPKTPKVDLISARRHLEHAKNDLGLEILPPLVLLTGDNPLSSLQSEYLQQEFRKKLGLEVKLDKQIFKQRLAKMTSGDFDMVLAGWGPDYDDPLTFGDLFASWNPNNRGRYVNAELDAQVAIAKTSLETTIRMEAFSEIQNILIDDAAILPLYERGSTYVVHPSLKGMIRRAVGLDPDYTYAYITEPQ